ncbi:MAG TPA: peptidoglycan DD-metalloendopeptidase family protein [Gemmatimonadales bacterium]
MRRAFFLFSVLVFITAAWLASSGRWPWARLPEARPIVVSRAFLRTADTLRPGETLTHLFTRQGLGSFDPARLNRELGVDLRRLQAGLVFSFRRAMDDLVPDEVVVRISPEERVRLERRLDGWSLFKETIAWSTETVRVSGGVGTSLYTALDDHIADELLLANERVRLAWDIADVYAWSVDFTRDIQPGDRFAVVLERRVSEEGEVRYGRVLAAAMEVGGKMHTAFRFDGEGKDRFYDERGNSLRRAFLRAPLQFRRISSNFSRSRFHPVLRIYRRHAGTDYSAAPGTPVLAAGDGTVTQAGRSSGYGILVELRHRSGITTRYAHLRGLARGMHRGARVRQGDVIGYVGATGLATAPHLHYEFRVNGVPRDSRRVTLDGGTPVSTGLRAAFEVERDRLAQLLVFVPGWMGAPIPGD